MTKPCKSAERLALEVVTADGLPLEKLEEILHAAGLSECEARLRECVKVFRHTQFVPLAIVREALAALLGDSKKSR